VTYDWEASLDEARLVGAEPPMSAETGRVAYMVEPGRLEIREYELPDLPDGALLVRTRAAGVCGSELHMFAGHHPLKSMVMGHEIIAEVTPASRWRWATGSRSCTT
jgi:threonine dehydrogenase-like Zn-dependent dehydrogenase